MQEEMSSGWRAAQRIWSWQALFGDATHRDISLSPEDREKYRFLMWRDLSTEYDARNFENYVVSRNLEITPEFADFCDAWKFDEQQHYEAIRRIVSLLYDLSEKEIDEQIEQQKPDFEPAAHLFTDEFRILALLAFDEVISARGYLDDVPMYTSFGHPGFPEWVKNASKDEAVHAKNALTLIRFRHPGRISEINDVLDEILDFLISGKNGYRGTFSLDDDYDESSFLMAADSVRNYFTISRST